MNLARSALAMGQPNVDSSPSLRDTYLERVSQLAPRINAAAETIEQDRRLPSDLLEGLHEAELFRMLLEKRFRGAELRPSDFAAVIEEVAKHDGSTAWCLCQANGCAMSASFLDDEVANQIWGDDPAGVLAWGPGTSTAVKDGDGFRVNAKTAFASGGRHATWVGTHATLVDDTGEPVRSEAGRRIVRTMLLPSADVAWEDIWHVVGLRGTASDGYVIDNLYVPYRYSLLRDDAAERRTAHPLYLFRQTNLYACGFSGVALGLAQAMLDAFAELATTKVPRYYRNPLSENAVVQSEFARASIRLNAARTFVRSELDAIWSDVCASGELSVAERMRIRLATTHAIHEAKAAADTIYDAAGSSAIFRNGPFERRFRDLHTVTQQAQGRRAHYETVGAFMLGNPPDLSAV
jgi:alkylation response protein AidB-like acyl-CoA dehydrogenase